MGREQRRNGQAAVPPGPPQIAVEVAPDPAGNRVVIRFPHNMHMLLQQGRLFSLAERGPKQWELEPCPERAHLVVPGVRGPAAPPEEPASLDAPAAGAEAER
jgi:hypothetical protein